MTARESTWHPDWSQIQLVVFDVDGTLYDQYGLRIRMLQEMLLAAARLHRTDFIRIVRAYRRIREKLGESMTEGFEQVLVSRTAAAVRCSEDVVRLVVVEWLEQRPLRHLIWYRYPNLIELFKGLRSHGKKIGVFSDYPAQDKLQALQVEVDFIVCAGDDDVRVLKPHPRGLQILMSRAGAKPLETLLIGDRPERDGLSARAAEVGVLIRSRKSIDGWRTFVGYDDPLFSDVRLSQ